jgi:hypothetical protein
MIKSTICGILFRQNFRLRLSFLYALLWEHANDAHTLKNKFAQNSQVIINDFEINNIILRKEQGWPLGICVGSDS